jgi:hypothetical protein
MTRIMLCIHLRESARNGPLPASPSFLWIPTDSRRFATSQRYSIPGASTPVGSFGSNPLSPGTGP